MDSKYLFSKTLEELKSRIDSADEYDILMAAGLLRKLLIDGENSLIFQINISSKNIKFNINLREPIHLRFPNIFKNDKNILWFAEDGLNPDNADIHRKDYNPKVLNLDDFLQCPVAFINGHVITVKDTIKYLSNKEGGVHKQKMKMVGEKEIKNILMQEAAKYFGINNLPAGLNTFRAICAIVYRDLIRFSKSCH